MIFDPTYLIFVLLPSVIIAWWAQAKVKNAFTKYSEIQTAANLTGAEAARVILDRNGLTNVDIKKTRGWLGDYYDPVKKELRLSESVFDQTSIAAVGIAAHEAGHALQQAAGYIPLSLRNAVVPMAAMTNLAWPLIIIGLIFHIFALIYIGIIFYFVVVVFQLINLPVEYNASNRAKKALVECGVVNVAEAEGVREVLSAAALTYVAAALGAILQLLYLIGLARRN